MFSIHSHNAISRWVLLLFLIPSISSQAAEPLRAVVVLDSSIKENEQAFLTIKGQTADLPATIRMESVSALPGDIKSIERRFLQIGENADIVFFPDFVDANRVVLYTSMPKIGTTLIRTIDAPGETLESRFEITAVMIRGIVTAMSIGGEIGVHVSRPVAKSDVNPASSKENAPASSACPKCDRSSLSAGSNGRSAESSPPKSQPLLVQDSFGIGLVSAETPPIYFIRPSIRVPIRALEVFLAYRFTLPFRQENDDVAADVFPHPIEFGFSASFHKNRLFFRIGASLIADPTVVRITAKTPISPTDENPVKFRLSASPFVSMDWFFSRRAYLFASISADVYIHQIALDIQQTDGQTVSEFLTLWKTSPVFQVGFGFGLL